MNHKGPLEQGSFDFAIDIVMSYKYLVEDKREYIMSKQLLRSGTAVGALIREAQNGESKKDFIHKLWIAQKECAETLYWLDLLQVTDYLEKVRFERLSNQANILLKMIKSAILTTKERYKLK